MGILLAGGRDGGGGTVVGGDLRLPPTEHGCTVYCDQVHYLPAYGGGAETRATGFQAVIGTWKGGFGKDADSGLGGGTDGGGEGGAD